MEIWIGRDGERHGPYKEDDVREWLRSGQVSPDDLAWYEGLADWQPLSVLFPDVKAAEAPASDNPYAAPGSPLMPQVTTASLEDHAGFWKRVAAYIIDAIVLYIPQLLIEKAFGVDAAKQAMEQALTNAGTDMNLVMAAQSQFYGAMWPAMVITFAMAWAYFAICESSAWQGTLGKLALGIRVTDMNGRRISFPRALGRYPAKILSGMILFIGFIMVAFTQRKQGLHDLICSTLVLNGRASEFKSNPASSDKSKSINA